MFTRKVLFHALEVFAYSFSVALVFGLEKIYTHGGSFTKDVIYSLLVGAAVAGLRALRPLAAKALGPQLEKSLEKIVIGVVTSRQAAKEGSPAVVPVPVEPTSNETR